MGRLLIAPLLLLAVCTLGAADDEARKLGPKEGSCLLLHGMGEMGTGGSAVKDYVSGIKMDSVYAARQNKEFQPFLLDALLDCTVDENAKYCRARWGKLPAKLLESGACDKVWMFHMNTLDVGWDWPIMQQKYCEAIELSNAAYVVTHSMGGLAVAAALQQLEGKFTGEATSYDFDFPKLTNDQKELRNALKLYLQNKDAGRPDADGEKKMKMVNGLAGYDSNVLKVSLDKLGGCQGILDRKITWILDQNPLKGSAAAVWLKTQQKSKRFINNIGQKVARAARTKGTQDLNGRKELSAAEFSLDPSSVQNWCQKLHPATPGCSCLFDAAAKYAKGGMCGRSRQFNIQELKKLSELKPLPALERAVITRGVKFGVPASVFGGKSFKRMCICGASASDAQNNDGMVGLSTCQVHPDKGWSEKVTSDWYITTLSHEGGTCLVVDSPHAENRRPTHFFVNMALKARGKMKKPMVDVKYHAQKKIDKLKDSVQSTKDAFSKKISGLLSSLKPKSKSNSKSSSQKPQPQQQKTKKSSTKRRL